MDAKLCPHVVLSAKELPLACVSIVVWELKRSAWSSKHLVFRFGARASDIDQLPSSSSSPAPVKEGVKGGWMCGVDLGDIVCDDRGYAEALCLGCPALWLLCWGCR
jgi:hypothetical protein